MVSPLLLLTLLGALQTGLWWHGRNVVAHAAVTAAEVESAHRALPGSGEQAARGIAEAGGVRDLEVLVHRHPDHVEVLVGGRVPLLVDLGLGTVRQQAQAPLERT